VNRRALLASTSSLALSAGCLRLSGSETATDGAPNDTDSSGSAGSGESSSTAGDSPTATATATPRTATPTTEPSGTRTTTATPSPTPASDAGLDETYGDDVDDVLWRVTRVTGGRYVAVGGTASGDGGGAWILETTNAGDVQWQETLGGTPDAVFYSVIEDASNDVLAVGTTAAGEDGDALIAKFDRGGSLLWKQTQESGRFFADLTQTDDGGYVTVGVTDRNGMDGYLNKWTNGGEFVGESLYGGDDTPDRLLWCLQPSDGGLLFVGDTRENSTSEGWLVRANELGEVQWTETYGGGGLSYLSQVIELSDGGYVAVGTKSSGETGKLNGWAIRVDGDGSLRWERGYDRNETDVLSGVTETVSGPFAVVGTTGTAGGEQNSGWVMQVSPRDGAPVGETTFDRYDKSALYGVEQVGSETLLTAGYAQVDGSDNDGWLTTVSTDSLAAGGFEGWIHNANNYSGEVADRRDTDETSIVVGRGEDSSFAYDPAVVRVDPGTTVTWEWSGEGGGHSVTHAAGRFDSGVQATGTFSHTFRNEGVYRYYCKPHVSLGMKGVVVVGDA
jgi:halocyanin-like protein